MAEKPTIRTIPDAVEAHFKETRPTARRSGRNPRWPYVPVIEHPCPRYGRRTEVICKRAFASRSEAVAYAARVIEARRTHFASQLADPRMRALRAQWGVVL